MDPHIHVRADGRSDPAVRGVLASAFGLAADLPAEVGTGCGLTVPIAMTSARPESVTCLPCREHARDQHLRMADQLEVLGALPGSVLTPSQVARAAAEYRSLARRFAD